MAKQLRWHTVTLVFIFCVLAIGIGTAGLLHFESHVKHIKQNVHDGLSAVAELKVNEISWWRRERLGDALAISENPLIGHEVQQWLLNSTESWRRAEILNWMDSLMMIFDYSDVLLIDSKGTLRLSASGKEELDTDTAEHLRHVMQEKKPTLIDLHRSESTKTLRLCVTAPMFNQREPDAPMVGLLVLQIDPEEFLFPVIQSLPTPSRTAETLLVRREGNEVVFLNELRHQTNSALSLRLPLSNQELPAAKAVLGWEGVMEGLDYRGAPVIGSLRAIPDSPWFLVAKVDSEEVYQPIHERAQFTAFWVGILIAVTGISLGFVWSHQHKQILRRAHDELEHLVEERTNELVKANDHLKREVREREQAERSVLEKSRILEAFFEHTITPMVFLDKDFNFIRANETYARACRRKVEEFPGRNHFEFHPTHTRAIFEQVVRNREAHQALASSLILNDHLDRGVSYWDWSLVPVLDSAEDVEFLVLSLNDVTERKRAEIALQKSEEKYRELVQNANSIILRMDAEGRVTFFNEFAQRFFGYTEGEILGRNVVGTIFPELDSSGRDLAVIMEDILHHPERHTNNENEHISRNGELHWVSWSNKALFDDDGELTGLLCIGTDITERRRAGEVHLRLAAIVESSHDAIIGMTKDGIITSWNGAAERIYGYSAEEAMGHSISIINRPDGPNEERVILETATKGDQLVNYECERVKKGGRLIDVSITASPIIASSGEVIGISSINRDISERKRVERELQTYTARLEQVNQELQEFAFVASHDLREPLRKIQAFGSKVVVRYGDTLDEEGKDYLKRMQSAAKRMEGLLDALLRYSRIGTTSKPFISADLTVLVQEVVSDLDLLIERRDAFVEVEELPTTEVDPDQMRQLFQNLITNALKFNRSEKPHIRVHGEAQPGVGCRIFVEDNGIGFDEKFLDRIFKPFQRLHGRSSEYEGTGMGLAICRKIAERHCGGITARSTPGRGSTFIVTLPLA